MICDLLRGTGNVPVKGRRGRTSHRENSTMVLFARVGTYHFTNCWLPTGHISPAVGVSRGGLHTSSGAEWLILAKVARRPKATMENFANISKEKKGQEGNM
jgi:hypothetical protein